MSHTPGPALVLAAVLAAACGGEPDLPSEDDFVSLPSVYQPSGSSDAPPEAGADSASPADTLAEPGGPGPDADAPAAPAADPDPASTTATTPSPDPDTADLPRYTIQVAAFDIEERAAAYRGRLAELGLPAWTERVSTDEGSYHRVRVGVTRGMTRARRLRSLLEERLGREIWISPLTSPDPVPAGIPEATRQLLQDG